MEHQFWHEAWSKADEPGWQQKGCNPQLEKHWALTGAHPRETVFVPLCGRSLDMRWLHDFGHPIVGVDLSETALETFCEQQSINASRTLEGELVVFRAPGWTLYAGDYFKLRASHLAEVTRVYDRAALIALPPPMRTLYAAHLRSTLPVNSEIFTITIAYDQAEMKGPPFSVPETEFRSHFADGFDIQLLESASGPEQLGNLKQRGLSSVTESCFLLRPKVVSQT